MTPPSLNKIFQKIFGSKVVVSLDKTVKKYYSLIDYITFVRHSFCQKKRGSLYDEIRLQNTLRHKDFQFISKETEI